MWNHNHPPQDVWEDMPVESPEPGETMPEKMTSDELTPTAFIKLRTMVASKMNGHSNENHGGSLADLQCAERLITGGYIDIKHVLNLP